eukprot:scaffold757_cov246-Pinguiococcus_pyrenoidosus.AAC.14
MGVGYGDVDILLQHVPRDAGLRVDQQLYLRRRLLGILSPGQDLPVAHLCQVQQLEATDRQVADPRPQ